MDKKQVFKIGIFIIAISTVIFGPLKIIYDISKARESIVKVAQATVNGKFIAYNSYNHATATCEYYVNGVRYTLDVMGKSESDVGQMITVHYNENNPQVAYTGSAPKFQDTLLTMVAVVVFLAVGTIVVLSKRKRSAGAF